MAAHGKVRGPCSFHEHQHRVRCVFTPRRGVGARIISSRALRPSAAVYLNCVSRMRHQMGVTPNRRAEGSHHLAPTACG